MTIATQKPRSRSYQIGWWILVVLSVISVMGHAGLAFALPDEAVLFIAWTVFPLYALFVLLIPYRRAEKWAWNVTWFMILPFALVFLFDADIGPGYLTVAVLMALAQFMTRGAFTGTAD